MYIPNTVAQGMLNGTGYATAVGTSPTLRIYSGTVPADADAALSSNTLLATLACAATPFSGFSSTGSGPTKGRATFGTITSATAAATGTATFWRLLKSDGTTVVGQGLVAAGSGAEMLLNTTAITSGSTVAITSGTIDLPTGP